MAQFNGEYVLTTVLGEFEDGRKVELGHYVDKSKKTEYGEKIYIRSSYTTKNGGEKQSIVGTKLTLNDLFELQKIDLSGFDTETKPKEIFE